MTFHQRLMNEPLFHFLAIGGFIFLLFKALSGPVPAPMNTIVIGPERIAQLTQTYQAVWQRPPTPQELSSIIDDAVREEVYYREALTLGLDSNDAIVRRRMRQKMEFLSDAGAELLEPVADELETHLLANQATFERGPRLAFEQIFLGASVDRDQAAQLLRMLQSETEVDLSSIGQRTLLPPQLDLSLPEAVNGVFGAGFFEKLAPLPTGVWSGPVSSGYGWHLVRIDATQAAFVPPLAEIRDIVLQDWRAYKANDLRELHYAQLRAGYQIEIRPAETETTENQ